MEYLLKYELLDYNSNYELYNNYKVYNNDNILLQDTQNNQSSYNITSNVNNNNNTTSTSTSVTLQIPDTAVDIASNNWGKCSVANTVATATYKLVSKTNLPIGLKMLAVPTNAYFTYHMMKNVDNFY